MTTIHPTAIVAPGAQLGGDVEIGAYSIVGAQVRIGDRTRIMPHVFLDGRTTLGAGCVVFPFASIGTQTQDLKFKGGATSVEIGDQTTLREYVTVNAGTNEGDVTRVGSRCHILAYSHVAHQCVIGNDVVISNATQLAGHVIVEDGVGMGGACGVHQFVRIGTMSFIGGCSKVTQDIPPYMLADGNPAVPRGINVVGLQRQNMPEETRSLLKNAFKILYRQELTTKVALEQIRTQIPACAERDRLLAFIEASERGLAR
jgi:UDP-N-acetylglucosamine acyltransferase